MKLVRIHIIAARSCGGLLDGIDVQLRGAMPSASVFEPLCLIGPNGAGKSQFIQVIAEAFQSLFHAFVPTEERAECNPDLQFEIEYSIVEKNTERPTNVRATRLAVGKRRPVVKLARQVEGQWIDCDSTDPAAAALLPAKVVGYTSGANETLSLPFLVSRAGYANDVAERALKTSQAQEDVPDSRLMLIDYGTHLEVLVANLLLGTKDQRSALLDDVRVQDLYSFRCVIQLARASASKGPTKTGGRKRKGIQLTDELESYIDQLQRCATSYHHEPSTDTYTFDFLVTQETRRAFQHFWKNSLALYAAFHKIAMLNDLAIPKTTRMRFRQETQKRKFASRLPEPQDEDKVFRFERVEFVAAGKGIVDYVSLSDGEHQIAQLLGTMSMVSFPNVLFLFDEPESHFNPQWRVKLLSRVLALPTAGGKRADKGRAAMQDGLLTTHSPFVASDIHKERVFIFLKDPESGRIEVRHPDIETFGTTFDAILSECFGIEPPISDVPMAKIEELKASDDPEEIRRGMTELGDSVEKIMLADRVRQLLRQNSR